MNLLTGEANVLTGPLFFKRTRQKIKNIKAATSQIPAGCAIQKPGRGREKFFVMPEAACFTACPSEYMP